MRASGPEPSTRYEQQSLPSEISGPPTWYTRSVTLTGALYDFMTLPALLSLQCSHTSFSRGKRRFIHRRPARFSSMSVSYTHLRAHETDSYLVCRLLLEKKKKYY